MALLLTQYIYSGIPSLHNISTRTDANAKTKGNGKQHEKT